MKPWGVGFGIALVVAPGLVARCDTQSSRSEEVGTLGDSYDCGALAFFTLCRLSRLEIGLDQIDSRLGGPSSDGHSLAEIQLVADSFGLRLRGVTIEARTWPIEGPAIVHLKTRLIGHYVVIRPVGADGRFAQVIDPASGTTIHEFQALASRPEWSGMALVVERKGRLTAARAAALVIVVAAVLAVCIHLNRIRFRRATAQVGSRPSGSSRR